MASTESLVKASEGGALLGGACLRKAALHMCIPGISPETHGALLQPETLLKAHRH
eukprot:CAMPEP_0172758192 /NCGR_PEP_ID=MMETSP1074-20121228/165266_1 /TAXON_ID=2916 /ORGANISM="Ceratium fusus, Strain PA161109" /LENGTH=54 /DNA_ID=CAMNT_0013591733 /DNA_START=27 /DNA_END=188 /DNA_ORIENTATION=-